MNQVQYYSYFTNKPLNYTGIQPRSFPVPENYYFQIFKLQREDANFRRRGYGFIY